MSTSDFWMFVQVGVATTVILMLLWGGVSYWVEQIRRDRVRVRPVQECEVCGAYDVAPWCSRLECPGHRPSA